MYVIGIGGFKRSGKDTFGRLLHEAAALRGINTVRTASARSLCVDRETASMRTIEKKQETRTFVEETITCDLCKRLLESAYTRYDRDNQVTLEAVLGELGDYPEAEDDRDVATLDCCGKCFTEKVRPCLETHLGVRFRDSNKSDVE